MTLTVDLKTWFKVIARPLPKGTLWVKYESDWAKGREYMLLASNIGLTADGQ